MQTLVQCQNQHPSQSPSVVLVVLVLLCSAVVVQGMHHVVLGIAVVGAHNLGVPDAESGCVPLALADNVLAPLNVVVAAPFVIVAILAVCFLAVVFAVPGSNDSHEFETDADDLQWELVSFVHYCSLVVALEIGAVAVPDTAGVI